MRQPNAIRKTLMSPSVVILEGTTVLVSTHQKRRPKWKEPLFFLFFSVTKSSNFINRNTNFDNFALINIAREALVGVCF